MAIGDIIVGIDIDYSKVSLMVAKIDNFNQLQELAKFQIDCKPYDKNELNPNVLIPVLEDLVMDAEDETGLKINSTYVTIPGEFVNVIQKEVTKNTNDKMSGITSKDIGAAMQEIVATPISSSQEMIDINIDRFILDNNEIVKDPLNKQSEKLTLLAQVITADRKYVNNLKGIFRQAKLNIDTLAPIPLIDKGFYLEANELNENIMIIDVGENSTEIGIFLGSSFVYSDTFKVGGKNITNNIAYVYRTSLEESEKLKQTYNLALKSYIEKDYNVQLSTSLLEGEQPVIKISNIVEIIEASVEDIFNRINREVKKTGLKEYINGIILCGDGITNLIKSDIVCTVAFNTPVKFATNKNILTTDKDYFRVYGLLKYFSSKQFARKISSNVGVKTEENVVIKILNKIKEFFYS